MVLGLFVASSSVACGDGDGGDGDGDGDGDMGGTPGDGDGDGDGSGGMSGDGDGDMPTACDISGAGLDTEVIPSEPGTMTLTSDKVWTLDSNVFVGEGDVLTIEPCTRIEGDGSEGVLIIGRGGQIMAEGTADKPILFTSWAAADDDAEPGDWGGIILLGNAPNNQGDAVAIEGLPPGADYEHGGDDADDSSGVMSYVRIEYPGVEIAPDNEINGLTLGSVGAGTTIDHIMVSYTLDDCFEWFGGTVDGSYLVANNCGDDMFDVDQGFQGSFDTLFGRQGSIDSGDPNGWETDGNNDAEPFSVITADKITLCGLGADNAPVDTSYGAVHRENLQGEFSNQVLVGFHEAFSLRETYWDDDADLVTLSDSMVFGNHVANIGSTHDSNSFDPVAWFNGGTNNTEPDPAPFTVDDCQADGGPNATVTGSETGAFTDEDDWMDGAWVSF